MKILKNMPWSRPTGGLDVSHQYGPQAFHSVLSIFGDTDFNVILRTTFSMANRDEDVLQI